MSNNAVAAYAHGLAPKSILAQRTGVSAALIDRFTSPEEWHHTSKYANETDFYSEEDVRQTFMVPTPSTFQTLGQLREAVQEHRDAMIALRLRGLRGKAKTENVARSWLACDLRQARTRQRELQASQAIAKAVSTVREQLREVIAGSRSTSPETLAMLAEDSDHEVRQAVAGNPSTSPETLAKLAQDDVCSVRSAVIVNPNANLAMLGEDSTWWVQAQSWRSAKELAIQSNDIVWRHTEMASCQATTPKTLTMLAKDSNLAVRRKVALNRSTPPETLAMLAEDSDHEVRQAVAGNRSTSPETLAMLAEDSNLNVRQRVASNPSTPPETLAMLAKQNGEIRHRVASNPSTPPEILLRTDNGMRHRELAGNPSTPPERLTMLAYSSKAMTRAAVATNPNSTLETLLVLATDDDSWVRKSVASAIKHHADSLRPAETIATWEQVARTNSKPKLTP